MSRITLGSPGWIYCMVSAATPDLCKLGATTNDVMLRAKQLTASTSAPLPFTLAYSRRVSNVTKAESDLHDMLADRRVNENREFFQCSVLDAVTAMDRIAGGDSEWLPEPRTPWAELFASFPDDNSPRALSPEEREKCRQLAAALAADPVLQTFEREYEARFMDDESAA